MQVLESIPTLRTVRQQMQGQVGLVPTMGYLHAGHMALVEQARRECDHVMVTIFVNPTQFSASEDLSSYPHDLPRDLALLEQAGVDAVFTPTPDMMYPQGYQTYVTVEQVTQGQEGASRPEHFRGVATIVTKLFNLIQAHQAYFGQKDAQQVIVIRRLVADLNIPINIIVHPIVREADGLAMSSRNVYLSPAERQAALVLSRALKAVQEAYLSGERNPQTLRQIVIDLVNTEPLAELDYVSLAQAHDLREVNQPTDVPLLLSLTARVGKPRLLDNCLLPVALNTSEGATKTLGITPSPKR
jgi:pantoate--beta-alanine ligase